jgi:hypothetical protein
MAAGAAEAGATFMRMNPGFLADLDAELAKRNFRPGDKARLVDGLRKAGLPVPERAADAGGTVPASAGPGRAAAGTSGPWRRRPSVAWSRLQTWSPFVPRLSAPGRGCTATAAPGPRPSSPPRLDHEQRAVLGAVPLAQGPPAATLHPPPAAQAPGPRLPRQEGAAAAGPEVAEGHRPGRGTTPASTASGGVGVGGMTGEPTPGRAPGPGRPAAGVPPRRAGRRRRVRSPVPSRGPLILVGRPARCRPEGGHGVPIPPPATILRTRLRPPPPGTARGRPGWRRVPGPAAAC